MIHQLLAVARLDQKVAAVITAVTYSAVIGGMSVAVLLFAGYFGLYGLKVNSVGVLVLMLTAIIALVTLTIKSLLVVDRVIFFFLFLKEVILLAVQRDPDQATMLSHLVFLYY